VSDTARTEVKITFTDAEMAEAKKVKAPMKQLVLRALNDWFEDWCKDNP
jgi:hypothetical protein